jgi:tetratricopeptide (TPR) repeat protein
MKKFLFILLAISLFVPTWAQEYHLQFSQALEKGDTNAQRATLNAWSKLQPTEADYYIDQFNFYVNRALSQTIILTQDSDEVGGEALTMTDTTGDIAGYLVMGVPTIESKMADSAILWINKGLEQHPYRLDMWMGRTHFLGITQRWDDFEHTLLELIDRYSTTRSKLWKYPDVGQFDKEMFSESILQYQQTLVEEINLSAMERSDTLMLNRMANIAQRMLKYYPKDIYQLNIMAVYHNALGQPEECLRYLLKAEKQDRRDCTVLANIANTYHTLENYKQERKYLEKLLKYGDEDSQEYARHFLKELESQGH